ncbi:nicotinamide riboside transporter PnuC [Leptospira ryugenii]|uniref:nicotinamide riboside transporter PnuC n=1 Tax=Leptospira ryugenii TaxID=1917863 RepID=UPI001FCE55AA|nr:nicotinamide riboside transporter PnuC [Leptospira ryugenii]
MIHFWGYELSLIEILGIVSGLLCVYTAAINKIITWPIGIFNSICFLFLFYQVQLYSDMLLQIYFFGSSIYGWIFWTNKRGIEIPIKNLDKMYFIFICAGIVFSSFLLGECTKRLPVWFPELFRLPPSFPYLDAFTTVASIVANFLLARRILDAWFLWVSVDIVCIGIYFSKEIPLIAIEYIAFLLFALMGLYHWQKEWKEKVRPSVFTEGQSL